MATLDSDCWVTLEDLKEHLNIDTSDTSYDNFLTNLLNACWKACVNYIGHDLTSASYTEDYSGDGSNSILLKNYPIISVSAIYDDASRSWQTDVTNADTLIDSTRYFIEDADIGKITLFDGSLFTDALGNIRVVYTAGFTSIPYDAQRALILLAAWYYNRAGSESKNSETLGGKSQQYELTWFPHYIRQMLVPYKKITI